jgi:hypothetical protein
MLAPFKIAAALLALLLCARSSPTQAADELHPRFFWQVPFPTTEPKNSWLAAGGAVYPDGGLAVAAYRWVESRSDCERHIFRIDAAGHTQWEFAPERDGEPIRALAADAGGGLVFCDSASSVRRLDAAGRPSWLAKDWTSPDGTVAHPYSDGTDGCETLLALPDGSIIVGAAVFPEWKTFARITRIDSSGRILWSSDMSAKPYFDGRPTELIALPDGDIEVLFNPDVPPSNAHPLNLEEPAFLEWRISIEGQWRPLNRMQQTVPSRRESGGIVGLYLSQGRLVRMRWLTPDMALPHTSDEDRLVFETWSLDGSRLLDFSYVPPPEDPSVPQISVHYSLASPPRRPRGDRFAVEFYYLVAAGCRYFYLGTEDSVYVAENPPTPCQAPSPEGLP